MGSSLKFLPENKVVQVIPINHPILVHIHTFQHPWHTTTSHPLVGLPLLCEPGYVILEYIPAHYNLLNDLRPLVIRNQPSKLALHPSDHPKYCKFPLDYLSHEAVKSHEVIFALPCCLRASFLSPSELKTMQQER